MQALLEPTTTEGEREAVFLLQGARSRPVMSPAFVVVSHHSVRDVYTRLHPGLARFGTRFCLFFFLKEDTLSLMMFFLEEYHVNTVIVC